MFNIRRIYDDTVPVNQQAIRQVQEILQARFPGLNAKEIARLPRQLRDPLKYRFRAILFVAEDGRQRVKGFAILLHAPDLGFGYLDFLASPGSLTGRGVGGALYSRVREESMSLDAAGLFFECLPDDPALCRDPETLRQNAARLRFYERFGARPLAGTRYETPLKPGGDNPPYLVIDMLGRADLPRRDAMRAIARAILERKYGDKASAGYIDMVVESIADDPVKLREPRYTKVEASAPVTEALPEDAQIALVVTDRHEIHHVRERGYVQSPARIASILREIEPTGLFNRTPIVHYADTHIKAVHDPKYIEYFRRVCESLEPDESVYPYVFPVRNRARPPQDLPLRAGYFCMDTFTPLNGNAFLAAQRAVDSALTGTQKLLEGRPLAYALVRPPGHHAERSAFGGFCYFNAAAIAAQYLVRTGKVAVLDIDYHHGNGTQDIFYSRSDVFTISIHGHPRFAYPYFSGFEDEKGEGDGQGYNVNMPLPEICDGPRFLEALDACCRRIERFGPVFLVVSLGLDTAKNDPTGTWSLLSRDFEENGRRIGALGLPTLVCQEGGYDNRVLGRNARHFFLGLWAGMRGRPRPPERSKP